MILDTGRWLKQAIEGFKTSSEKEFEYQTYPWTVLDEELTQK